VIYKGIQGAESCSFKVDLNKKCFYITCQLNYYCRRFSKLEERLSLYAWAAFIIITNDNKIHIICKHFFGQLAFINNDYFIARTETYVQTKYGN